MAGGAVAKACKALIPRIVTIGAHLMQAAVGRVRYENAAVIGPLREVTARMAEAWYFRPDRLPPDVDRRRSGSDLGYNPKVDTGAFSYASHAAVVAVDTELGEVEILDYVIVEDCGTMVNPMSWMGRRAAESHRGSGPRCMRKACIDADGQPLASTLADYLLPGATEFPTSASCTCRRHRRTPSSASRGWAKAGPLRRRPRSLTRSTMPCAAWSGNERDAANAR